MAQTDSGLGWSCDSDYYVADTTTNVGNGANKTAAGAAICCGVVYPSTSTQYGWHSAILLSTVAENVEVNVTGTAWNNTSASRTYIVDGTTWYISILTAMQGFAVNSFPEVTAAEDFDNVFTAQIPETVSAILTAANVQIISSENDIPTVDYVKGYVEGVIRGNNDRMVKPSAIGAPAFSEAVSYSAGDIVMKDGELFRCTASHTGAWSSSDFTATSILEIIAG